MRVCIDLDGTICETRRPNQTYDQVEPLPGAVEKIREMKDDGYYIIIYTARHMKTCNNNLGQIVATQVPVIIRWLDKHKIPYDEIWPGKPLADHYIDDKAIRFTDWDHITL